MRKFLVVFATLLFGAISQAQVYPYFPPPGVTYSPTAGMSVGNPTGGAQGTGTVNTTGVYVNGVTVPNYPRTPAEIAAGVTPVNYGYESSPENVLRFGADPTGTNDSTTALTNALAGGSTAYFPCGTYKFTTTSVIDVFGERIVGQGENCVILKFPNETGYAFQVGGTDTAAPALIGFQLQGNANAAGGILFSEASVGVRRGLFEDVYVTGFTKAGTYAWDIQGNANNGIYYNTFINCAGDSSANGWRLYTTDAPGQPNRVNENTFIQDSATFNTGDAVYMNYGSDNTFVSIDRESNGGWGFNLQGQDLAVNIQGGDSENNTSGSINKAASNSDVHVLGGNITEATGGTWTDADQFMPGGVQLSGKFGVEPNGAAQVGGGLGIMDSGVTCAMSAGTSCTATVPTGSVHCAAYAQGATAYYAACGISGTTATVTANASNSATWLVTATQ